MKTWQTTGLPETYKESKKNLKNEPGIIDLSRRVFSLHPATKTFFNLLQLLISRAATS
jgi:hypothetical protein